MALPKPKVLVVDDRAENILAARSVIESLAIDIFEAASGAEALRLLLQHDFAVILLDVQMPIMGGFEAAHIIRSRRKSRHTPIIFITAGEADEAAVFRGYALGAVDYLTKPFVPELLRWKVSVFADLYIKAEQGRELAREQAARQEWEAAAKRSALLADITSLLASSMNYAATTAQIPDFLVPDFADWAKVITRAENAATLAQIAQPASPVLLDPVEPSFFDVIGVPKGGLSLDGSALVIPLRGRTLLVAALVMFRAAPRRYGTTDRLLADELAERAALAITNAQLFEEVQAASRAKDEFLAVVSHELRTPLNGISGWTHILRTKNLIPEIRDKAFETIERNVRIQNDLIGDMLDFSRIAAGQFSITFQDLSVDTIVRNTLDTLKPTADAKRIHFNTDIEANMPMIAGDPKRLQQVLWNLIANAIKFTPASGSVDVTVDTTASYVRVRVHDTGSGIKQELQARIFEPFFQADSSFTRPHGGLGLGLAITRHLVELHGGTVKAESPGENQGATFTVLLPIRHVRERAS